MYTPAYAKNNDELSIKEFIRQNGFGIIVSQAGQRMVATHIPLIFSDDETRLLGHVSKANPQWNQFHDDSEVLAIFSGPHAYISSSWYDHVNVPTWNYIAVHVYGKIKIIEGNELYQSLKYLVDKYETGSNNPVSIEKMPADYVRKSMNGLVGFEITISSMEAAYKLSQNRDKKNHQNIINALVKTTDHGSHMIAQEMKKNIKS